jgi:hypothetical protein
MGPTGEAPTAPSETHAPTKETSTPVKEKSISAKETSTSTRETYRFIDRTTGLAIDLPRGWERRDPDNRKKQLVEANEKFWGRAAAERVKQEISVIFVALASPYDGPEKTRSTLVCLDIRVPPSARSQPAYVKRRLEEMVQATYGRYERGASVSPATKVVLGGHEAYQLSVLKKNDAPGSALLVMLLKGAHLIQCSGVFDARHKAVVERSLTSLRFD